MTITMDEGSAAPAGSSGVHGLAHKLSVKAPRLSKGNTVLAGMFAAGIGCFFLLAARSGPSQASAQQTETQAQVESALSRLTEPSGTKRLLANKDDAMTNTFYYEARHRHIPLAALRSNPFVFTRDGSSGSGQLLGGTWSTGKAAGDLTMEAGQALLEARKLTLQTILTGSSSTAMISNNLLTEGQKIRGWTVSKIRPKEVVLTWKDKTYVLKLPSQR